MRNASSGNVPKMLGKRPLHSSRRKNSNASVRRRTPRRRPLSNELWRLARSRLLPKHNAVPTNNVPRRPSNANRLNKLPKNCSGAPRSKKHNKKRSSVSKRNRRLRRLSVGLKSSNRRMLVSVKHSRRSKLNRPRNKKNAECPIRRRVRNDRQVLSLATQQRKTWVEFDEVFRSALLSTTASILLIARPLLLTNRPVSARQFEAAPGPTLPDRRMVNNGRSRWKFCLTG